MNRIAVRRDIRRVTALHDEVAEAGVLVSPPRSAGYVKARTIWNGAVDREPPLVRSGLRLARGQERRVVIVLVDYFIRSICNVCWKPLDCASDSEAGMDSEAFAAWRAGVGFLTATQRGLAFLRFGVGRSRRSDRTSGCRNRRNRAAGRGRTRAGRRRADCSRAYCRGEARAGTALKGRARSDRRFWLSSLRRFRDRRLGPRERHA